MKDDYRAVFINLIKRPRKAFDAIHQYGLDRYKYPLLILAGITGVVNKRILTLADSHENYLFSMLTTIAIGALVGWLGIFIFSGLVSVVGKWLKGYASFDEILNIAAYSTLPILVMLVSNFICIAILRSRGYSEHYRYIGFIDSGNINQIALRVNRYISLLMNVYYLVLFVTGISVVQGFTFGKALLNLLIVLLSAALLLAMFIGLPFLFSHSHS